MMRALPRLAAIVVTALQLSAQSYDVNDLADAFPSDVLVIAASENACYRFEVFLALTREQQSRGLMHVRDLPDFHGMLFVHRRPIVISMWMKNTFIPLDMVFIRADGSISSIEKNTEPQSLASIRSLEPLNYILELNAGITDRLGIDTDSRVHLPQARDEQL